MIHAETTPVRRRARFAALVAGLIALPLVLAGCGAQGTGDKGYVEGNGVISERPAGQRQVVGPVSGTTLEGKRIDLSAFRGKVVVVNLWWSQCPPCRAEAPSLVAAAKALMPQGVVFLGINTRDASTSGPLGYQRAYHLPFESIYDPDGQSLLAFRGALSPNAIPSTVVIDKQGRIAATVLGEMSGRSTLFGLVQDAGGPVVKAMS